jgi:hypothetical protein
MISSASTLASESTLEMPPTGVRAPHPTTSMANIAADRCTS